VAMKFQFSFKHEPMWMWLFSLLVPGLGLLILLAFLVFGVFR